MKNPGEMEEDLESCGVSSDGYSVLDWAGNVTTEGGSSSSSIHPSNLPNLSHDLFNLALISERKRAAATMPWERGFYAKVMGTNKQREFPYFPPAHPPAHVYQRAQSNPQPLQLKPTITRRARLGFAVRKLRAVNIGEEEDYLRFRGLNRWRVILESDLEMSVVGQQLSELVTDLHADAVIAATISDVFAKKSTATILKRAAAIMLYLKWARRQNVERPLGFVESCVYAYVCDLRLSNAAATTAVSFTQAVNFCIHTCGFSLAVPSMQSQRIKGACSQQFRRKRPLKQAPALTVLGLKILENCCNESTVPFDVIDSGQMVFCSLSSSRWGDAQSPTRMLCDLDQHFFGFVQLDTQSHKTATTDEKKSMFLPLVAVSPGFLDKPWTKSWLKARKAANLEAGVGPMVPVPSANGCWTKRKLSSGEATVHMREILVAGGMHADDARKFSTHSLKASILSMACKYGLDLPTRRLLGHHVDKDHSTLSYSRDALSVPLSRVIDMIGAIKAGTFDPDSTRMERAKLRANLRSPVRSEGSLDVMAQDLGFDLNVEGQGDEWECRGEHESDDGFGDREPTVNDMLQADSSSDSSSAGSSSDDSLSESEIETAEQEFEALSAIDEPRLERPSPFGTEGDFDVMQHNTYGTMHVRTKASPSHLMCGRIVSAAYSLIRTRQTYQWPICRVCLKKRPKLDFLIPTSKAPPPVRV